LAAVAALFACGPTEVLVGDAPGLARIVAGEPGTVADFTGDSIPVGDAISIPIGRPQAVAAASDGSFYFSDLNARRVGFVSAAGVLSWPIGLGLCRAAAYDRDPKKLCLGAPDGLALESAGTLLIVDRTGTRIYRFDPNAGTVTVVMGTGAAGAATNGMDASSAPLTTPSDVAVGSDGAIYVVEINNHRVLKIGPDNKVLVVAGDGTFGDSGDGGPATAAELALPEGVAVVGDTLYIADTENSRIRRVINDTIYAYAGVGAAGFSGDGHSVSLALFDHPARLTSVPGLLFVSDRGNHRIRLIRIGPDSITTFAGTGATSLTPDLQDAGRTDVTTPAGLATAGRAVFFADPDQFVVRRVVR
jgi:hypothetical protein